MPRPILGCRSFLINISGAFPMGYLSVLFAVDWHTRHGTALTALCLTGIIGGYTTFSTMQTILGLASDTRSQ